MPAFVASGRRRPVAVPGSDFDLECDTVVCAIGTNANPILAGGAVYVTAGGGALVALDAASGQTLWSQPIGTTPIGRCNPFPGGPIGAPAVVGGTVFVPGGDTTVYAFDKDTGRRLWATALGDGAAGDFLWASAFPLHGRIFVGVGTLFENVCAPVPGRLVALDEATGTIAGTWWVDPARRSGGGIWKPTSTDETGISYC